MQRRGHEHIAAEQIGRERNQRACHRQLVRNVVDRRVNSHVIPQEGLLLNGTSIVAIVVDPEFGERLVTLAKEAAVWIADTPVNRSCAESIWSASVDTLAPGAVTTFRVNAGESPELWCRGVLPQVDLHHGSYSQSPAYCAVDVFGTRLTPELREAFEAYGFQTWTERPDGFRAARESAAG